MEKLDRSENNNLKDLELKALKDEEIDTVNVKIKKLVSENKTLRKDLKELYNEFVVFKCESMESKIELESKVEILEKRFEDQRLPKLLSGTLTMREQS